MHISPDPGTSQAAITAVGKALSLLDATRVQDGSAQTFGEWFRSLPIRVRIFHGQGSHDFSYGEGYDVRVRDNDLSDPVFRQLYDPQSGVGYATLAALLLHEGRHTDPGGGKKHFFGGGMYPTMDKSLEEQGAWWIEHVFYRALARKPELDPTYQRIAAHDAQWVLGNLAYPPAGVAPRIAAIAKVPHLSADACLSGGWPFPYCSRAGS